MSTAVLDSACYRKLPSEVKFALHALSVLIERIGSLPKTDRDDLFLLIQEWKDAKHQEDRERIQAAMEEIIAQEPLKFSPMKIPDKKPSKGVRNWAEYAGKRILELRKSKNMTQEDLAARSGLQQSHISRIEQGEYSPTHLTVSKIAKALGVAIRQIDPSHE